MVFYVTGPDTYRARKKLREIRDKFRREVDASGLNILSVDGAKLEASEVAHYFDTMPLLARRRFIAFEGALGTKRSGVTEALLDALKRHDKEANVLVFYEEKPPTAKHKLGDWLKKNAYVQQFDEMTGVALTRWVKTEVETLGRTIDPKALSHLVASIGSNQWALANGLKKLDLALALGEPITETVVEEHFAAPVDDNVFTLVDAIVGGNVSRAIERIDQQLSGGLSPQQLTALLETSLRVLVALATDPKGKPPGAHPFVVKKLTPLARKLDASKARLLYERLAQLDQTLKSTSTDPKILFMRFAADMAAGK